MRDDMAGHVAAYEQTVRSMIGLAETLAPADWELPTECPGWSVRDQVSHIVGVEHWLLGEPDPGHTPPPELPHIRNDFGRALEVAIDARRSVPGPKVLDELRDVLDRRLAALPGIDPDQQAMLPTGRSGSYADLMRFRTFDIWTHEQDIRRAVGRPGNLAAPAAERARDIMASSLSFVVGKRAAAAPGESVTLDVTGPLAFTRHVVVGPDGRADAGAAALADPPTATLRIDWETYARLCCGRIPAEAAHVTVSGDPDLAHRILGGMAITP